LKSITRNFFLCIILVCSIVTAAAQNKYYFISFNKKDTSNFSKLNPINYLSKASIERRLKLNLPPLNFNDLPVDTTYIKLVSPFIISFQYKLNWLNGLVVKADDEIIKKILKFDFVKDIKQIGIENSVVKEKPIDLNERINALEQRFDNKEIIDSNLYYGKATDQILFNNINKLHELNFKGNDINIAVFDAGFNNFNNVNYFNSNKIKGIYSLNGDEENELTGETDEHGLNVLSIMAANVPYKFVGTAPNSNYYLFSTENSNFEYPIEEYNWAKAAEIADSIGVSIIISSLGYSEFDDKSFNHKVKEFSGDKTIIAKVVNLASKNGILVIVSAGNEGNKIWETITTPADADSVLSVGSCNIFYKNSIFSSIGISKRNMFRPQIVTIGELVDFVSKDAKIKKGNGTSYATPIIAGGVACLMQAFPNTSNFNIKQMIALSSNNYNNPNKYIGYGTPNFLLTYQLLENYKQDTIIDVTELDDKNLHVSLNTNTKQKIQILMTSMDGKSLIKQTERVELNVNRFCLNKTYKLKKGLYILKIKTANTVLIKQIDKK
jgi:serine protease AprX